MTDTTRGREHALLIFKQRQLLRQLGETAVFWETVN